MVGTYVLSLRLAPLSKWLVFWLVFFFLNTLIFTLFYFLFIVLQLLGIIMKSIKRTFLIAYIFFLCHWFMDFIELLKLQIVLSYKGKNC